MTKLIYIFSLLLLMGCSDSTKNLSGQDLADLMAKKPDRFFLVDVRTAAEYQEGHIPGSININHTDILLTPPTTDKDATIVLYCRTGNRSAQSLRALERAGYTKVINFGGIGNWRGELKR